MSVPQMIFGARQADEHPVTANHHRSQMKDYRTIETSAEVWAVIRAATLLRQFSAVTTEDLKND
jgi:hypothetical protein